jgi:ABC-2 type transport system permease protein
MNIFLFEIKKFRLSFVFWILAIIAVIFVFMAFFPVIIDSALDLDTLRENYPPELLKAFGLDSGLSLNTITGYFSFVFVTVQLCAAIYSSNFGFGLLSEEERALTADFLMTKPVHRYRIFWAKLFTALLYIVLFTIIIAIASFGAIELFKEGQDYVARDIFLAVFSLFPFQLFFVSVGMTLSLLVPGVRSVISYSIGLSLGLYVLNAVQSIVGGEYIAIISPFYHYDISQILSDGSFNVPLVLFDILFTLVGFISSYILYIKRNIHSV